MKTNDQKSMKVRIVFIGIIFSVMYLTIGVAAVKIQIFEGDWLSKKAEKGHKKFIAGSGKRGTIYDANYKELAVTIDSTSIAVRPKLIINSKRTAVKVAKILGLNRKNVEKKFASKKNFVWLIRHATQSQVENLKRLNIEKGILFLPEHRRFFPSKELAGQVIGFTGIDGNGLEGIEYLYDKILKEKEKTSTIFLSEKKDLNRKNSDDLKGLNIVLTIDKSVQYIAETAIEKAAKEFEAKRAFVVVMSPKTGAVFAIAQYPFFDPNNHREFNSSIWRNRAVSDQFEPGSTLKTFLAAAALKSQKCDINTIFFCENGSYNIGRNRIHDTHSHGWLTLLKIIKFSSNIGSTKVIEEIGKKNYEITLRNFGFGRKTGIDYPGETKGMLANSNKWTNIDASAISFGQGVSVSAMQLAAALSAIANKGLLYKPYILKAVTDENGNIIKKTEPEFIRRVISEKASVKLAKIMHAVTQEGGTGVNAAINGYLVCGKTGTAQKIDKDGKYAKNRYIASFIGFAPAEDPEITVVVVVDEPRKQHYGGIVAAPVFKEIVFKTLNYLNILPDIKVNRFTVDAGKRSSG